MRGVWVGAAAVVVLVTAAGASGAQERSALGLVRVVGGLSSPVHVATPAGEPRRLYVVEQAGRIRVVERGRVVRTFLDIRGLVASGGERGLLSVAFHPNYGQNRHFYVNYTDLEGHTRVVEYRSNGRTALTGSRRQLLRVQQPYSNHNGGQLAFGPEGLLYIGMGDGGAGGDPENRAQNMGSRLGKLLTLDVNRRGAQPRITALGLRNPWRFSFDRANGNLYIGDVGQNAWEEVNFLPRGRLGRLQNYGWNLYEGRARFRDGEPSRGDLISPVAVYPNAGGNCSVTGGFVYRGAGLPGQRGRYFYGDYCSGNVWSFRIVNGSAVQQRREPFRVQGLTSFGEDARGELYLVAHGGTVFRLRR